MSRDIKNLPGLELEGAQVRAKHPSSVYFSSKATGRKINTFPGYKQLGDQTSPENAMKFLCRSWSPAAFNFLQISSSSKPCLPSDNKGVEEHEERHETLENIAKRFRSTANEGGNTVHLDHTTTWLTKKSLTSYFISHKGKRKEQIRLHTSQLHAALSLTQLAAAIAGVSSSTGKEGDAVISVASLLSTVFAEAAESLGAERTRVASAVNSGLAVQSPMDMIAVTAAAATCLVTESRFMLPGLRGANILKLRAANSFSQTQDVLNAAAQICIVTPSGHRKYARLHISLKQKYLILSFRKKYCRGAFTTSKEYKVISIIEGSREEYGHFSLSLNTKSGLVKLLFEDEKQSKVWVSTILNLLEMINNSN